MRLRKIFLMGWPFLFLCSSLIWGTADSERAAEKKILTDPNKIDGFLNLLMQAESISIPYYEHYDISPDGRWVAFTIQRPFSDDDIYPLGDLRRLPGGIPVTFVRQDIWVAEFETGRTHRITDGMAGKNSYWHPVWAPNSRDLAFYGDAEGKIRLFIRRDATDEHPEVDLIENVILKCSLFRKDIPRWTGDGKYLVVPMLPGSDKNFHPGIDDNPLYVIPDLYAKFLDPRENPTSDVLNSKDPDDLDQFLLQENRVDLGLFEIGSNKIKRLTEGMNVMLWELSPDSQTLAFKSFKGVSKGSTDWIFDVYVLSLEGGEPRLIMENAGNGILWSPNGRRLLERKEGRLYSINVFSGKQDRITPNEKISFDPILNPPGVFQLSNASYLWSPDGKHVLGRNKKGWWLFSADGSGYRRIFKGSEGNITGVIKKEGEGQAFSLDEDHVFLEVFETSRSKKGLVEMNLRTGESKTVAEDIPDFCSIYDLSKNGREAVILYSLMEKDVNDLWGSDLSFSQPVRFTDLNAEIKACPRGKTILVDYRSLDGQKLKGAVLLPLNYQDGEKYPMVADVYAGSMVNMIERAFPMKFSPVGGIGRLLSQCGYVVIRPSIPLTPMESKGSSLAGIPKSVVPAVNAVIDRGIADPEGLGVIGQSYGGYTVNVLVTQTEIFKAAVGLAGVSDLVSNYGVFDARSRYIRGGSSFFVGWSEAGQGRMGVPIWEDRMQWIENSPVFFLNRVRTPLLLIHGDLDFVAIQQAEQMFSGLKRLGKEAEFVRYFGEGHVLSKPVNIRDSWRRIVRWFDSHLKN